jgi:hypothetical protein
VGVGQTNITVSFLGNDNYLSSQTGYLLTITAPEPEPDPDPIVDSVGKVIIGGETMPIYSPTGQRLDKPRKGLNIIGGKKVYVK